MADLRSYIQGIDLDSGAGTDLVQGVALLVPASGGAVTITGDAANGLDVDVTRVQGTVTVDSELPAAAALADATANPTVPGVGAFLMAYDGTDWDRVRLSASNGSLNVAVTGTAAVDTELPAAAALADNAANPTTPLIGACLLGFDGTTWDRLYAVADGDAVAAGTKGFLVLGTDGSNYQVLKTDAAGELQVDVLTGGGSDTPTNPATDYVTSASLAAGSEVNLDTADIPAKKLRRVDVWSSVAYRARVFLVNNSVEATEPIAVGGGPAFAAWTYSTPHRNYAALGTTAGTDAFRVEVTNLDDANAADVYATFAYED